MTLEESTIRLKKFEAYLTWNKKALEKKSITDLRHLLESCLDASLGSKLEMDDTVSDMTKVQGEDGCLAKLKNYFLDDYPLMMRRHQFQECVQAPGESFKTWWDRTKAKAMECALETMSKDDMLMLQLIRGMIDSMLRKRLLQEKDPTMAKLVGIAEQWQVADNMQAVLGFDGDSYVRKASSEYRNQKNEKWRSDSQPSDRQKSLDECSHCGVRGDRMHNRDACPAKDKNRYNCGTVGHFRWVCRKPKKTARTSLVRVAETHGGGSDPTPMMRGVKVTLRDGGAPFVFNMCPDTGCTQTLVSEDVVSRQGLAVSTRSRKRVRAVNDQKLDCSGMVVFDIEF